jgi:TP901 family phage tail tape measure protein
MSIGAIEAGRAFVRLLVNDKELTKGLKRAQNKVKMFAASTGQMGRQLLAASSAMAAPLIAGTKVYADFEQQMANVSTMLDDPAAHMQQFQDGIKRMQVEFGESSEALAGGLYDILSASIPAAKALDVLEVATKAATAGITDTKTAADAITTILNSYGMAAEQAGDVSDLLFTIVKRGKTTFAELAPNIGKVTSVAAIAGVGLDELGAMLATLTRNGLKTDDAITAVANVIQTFLKPSDEARQIAKDLGFEMSTATLKAEGLAGVFERIASLPPEAVSKLFPNIRAIKGLAPALNNMEALTDDIAAMRDSAGATETAFSKMTATMSKQFDKLWQAITVAANEIGAALSDSVEGGAESITAIAGATADWIKENQGLVDVLGKVVLVAGAVGGALLAASVAGYTMSGAMTAASMASGALSTSLTFLAAHPVVAVLIGIAAVVGTVGYAMDAAAGDALRLSDAMGGLLKKGDKERQQDLKKLDRLKALSKEQKLSNEEMDEAAEIIERLNGTYGDLGLSLDKTTGKISGVTDAYTAMTQAMQSHAEAEIRAAMIESTTHMQLLGEEMLRIRDAWMTPWGKSQALADASMEMEKAKAKAAALMQRLEALKGGETAAIFGEPPLPGAPVTAPSPAPAQAQRQTEYELDLAKRLHEARLAMIADEEARALKRIRAQHKAEMDAAVENKQNTTALANVQAAEIAAIEAEHQRRRDEEKQREDDAKARRQADLQEDIEDLTVKTQYDGLDEQLQLLENQRKRAIAEAETLGLSVDEINKKYDLLTTLAKQGDTVQDVAHKTSPTGTFSAQLAGRLGGASSIDKKQLDAMEKIEGHTAGTKRALENWGSLV